MAYGEYHRERGDLDTIRQILEALVQRGSIEGPAIFVTPIALAETLLALGDLPAAETAATQGLAGAQDPKHLWRSFQVRSLCVLARIAAAEGDGNRAATYLELGHTQARVSNSPTLMGSLYEAEAHIAWSHGDTAGYHRACAALHGVYTPTANPLLIARAHALSACGRPDANIKHSEDDAHSSTDNELVTLDVRKDLSQVLQNRVKGCHGATQRYDTILDALLEISEAQAGFLFDITSGGPRLLAPEQGDEPPAEVEDAIARIVPPDETLIVGDHWWIRVVGSPCVAIVALHRPSCAHDLIDTLVKSVAPLLSEVASQTPRPAARIAQSNMKR